MGRAWLCIIFVLFSLKYCSNADTANPESNAKSNKEQIKFGNKNYEKPVEWPHLWNDERFEEDSEELKVSPPVGMHFENRRTFRAKSCNRKKDCVQFCINMCSSSLSGCYDNECWCRPV